MIVDYPELTDTQIARRGETWIQCDEPTCAAEALVEAEEEASYRGRVMRHAPMPPDWRTSDPEDNALAGAAQFCPTHADRIYVTPPGEEVAPITG